MAGIVVQALGSSEGTVSRHGVLLLQHPSPRGMNGPDDPATPTAGESVASNDGRPTLRILDGPVRLADRFSRIDTVTTTGGS